MRLGVATAVALATTALSAITGLAPSAIADTGTSWTADLATAEAVGVVVAAGTARLGGTGTFRAPATEGGPAPLVRTGLLTFPARDLPTATDRIDARLAGAAEGATVDVRARRANGGWTEWLPADPAGTVALPQPATEVQGRLVLSGDAAAVSGVTLSARPAAARTEAAPDTESAPLSYRVFATREGLVGGTTSNGHVIAERDQFVALPSRRALSANGKSDYTVKVCAPNGRCAFAPVWDVGPWNTRDDYWNAPGVRQEWGDLPQGTPQSQAAHLDGYNGGKDQFDRDVLNPAGIDLADGVFWDTLGLTDNSWVTVDYLWTGSVRLSRVTGDTVAEVLAAPDRTAAVVGIAAGNATVPVQCRLTSALGTFLQIGVRQFLHADAVPDAGDVAPCPATPTGPAPASPAAPGAAAAAAAPAAPAAATTAGTRPATAAGESPVPSRRVPRSARRVPRSGGHRRPGAARRSPSRRPRRPRLRPSPPADRARRLRSACAHQHRSTHHRSTQRLCR